MEPLRQSLVPVEAAVASSARFQERPVCVNEKEFARFFVYQARGDTFGIERRPSLAVQCPDLDGMSQISPRAVIRRAAADLFGIPGIDRRNHRKGLSGPTSEKVCNRQTDRFPKDVPAGGIECRFCVIVADERGIHRVVDAVNLARIAPQQARADFSDSGPSAEREMQCRCLPHGGAFSPSLRPTVRNDADD